MDWGSTSAGVFIQRRIVGVIPTPRMVRIPPATSPKATSVWMASRMAFSFFAPYSLAMITPAPMATPWKKPTSMKIKLPEELTAARAWSPRNFPTIRESKVLYNCWKTCPRKIGSAKKSSFFQIVPSVRLFFRLPSVPSFRSFSVRLPAPSIPPSSRHSLMWFSWLLPLPSGPVPVSRHPPVLFSLIQPSRHSFAIRNTCISPYLTRCSASSPWHHSGYRRPGLSPW